ncbi:YhdP family protein [Comamonas thiooxydans]|uniref:YhdP family protein n=1 Tax=Comamonas thiooxydans TaxID=363952 RepID=UPI003C6EE602
MIEPKPLPTRQIHRLASLARWSLGLVLSLWLLLATVWGVLHFWIVPRIEQWRPELESLASRSLGVPVSIGRLNAYRSGLVPTFELGDVVLHDPANKSEALLLPKVVVAVSAHSLMTLGVEQIYLEGPDLTVRRDADGQIFVAGIAVSSDPGQGTDSDWIFSQPEIAIRSGKLQWVDELRNAAPLQLQDVDLVLRNKRWHHSLRLDATPPEGWGQRFTVMGNFKEPLLSVHEGRLERWSGQAYLDFTHIDLSHLGQYLGPQDWKLQQGKGSVRAWLDVEHGQPVGGVADVAVQALQLQWRDRPEPLALQALRGRLRAKNQNGYQFSVQGLQFTADDGLNWPRGDFSLRYVPTGASEQGSQGEHGEVQADGIDLAIAAQMLQRLPLPQAVQTQLKALAPAGQLSDLKLSWRGPLQQLAQYKASGRFEQLGLRSQASQEGPHSIGIPGVRGLSGKFSLDQDSGEATLTKTAAASQAMLSFPGVFEDPDIPFDQFDSLVRWQLLDKGQSIKVQVPRLRFANEDTAGQAQASWQSGAGTKEQPRFPGLLDLQGQLSRAKGERIYRYLPQDLGSDALRYVREAITTGQASAVNFRVKGELEHVPFEKPGKGEFHISAQVHDVNYQFVPGYLLGPGEKPWPPLTRLSGELVFDRNSMQVRKAKGFLGHTAIVVDEAQAGVADWNLTEVEVNAKAHGALGDMLNLVQGSALSALTAHALDGSKATGNAKLSLRLHLPTMHMERSKVQGEVALAGNTLQLMPEVPTLSQLRGNVQFSETGFQLSGVQARALGGDVRIEGGMKPAADAATAPVQVRVDGIATAQGLRDAKEMSELVALGKHLQGQARYGLQIKVLHSVPEISLQSDLQGMAVMLPAPLGKAADSSLALRVNRTVPAVAKPLTDQFGVQWGNHAAALLERDISGAQARITRGSLELVESGTAEATLPPAGLQARVQLPVLDLDAWSRLWPDGTGGAADGPGIEEESWRQFVPQQLALQAREVKLHGRSLHDVSLQLSHASKVWINQIQSRELAGRVEYREPSAQEPGGLVIAKLSRLSIPDGPDEGLDAAAEQTGNVRELPALQVSVDDFQLGKRSLGKLDVVARNHGLSVGAGQREWQLSRFNISTPEATLTAQGSWGLRSSDKKHPGQTQLQFQLNLRDVGKLLNRFDMPGVVANGQGQLQGEISWTGAPVTPEFKTMSGAVHLEVQKGQFLKADPGLAKLLGVLSLQSLPRRLTLDFRDVFRNGFSFDFMRGDVTIERGIAKTNNMQMKGVNAAVLMEGSADIDKETQDLHVVVVPEINALSASLVATAINPVVGLSSFLAQMILRGPLIAATTKEFHIHGSWEDPQVTELPRRSVPKAGADDAGKQPAAAPSSEEKP